MKIKILQHTVADGKDVSAGDIVDVSIDAAAVLVAMGRATRKFTEKPAPVAAEIQAPFVEHAVAERAPETAAKPRTKVRTFSGRPVNP